MIEARSKKTTARGQMRRRGSLPSRSTRNDVERALVSHVAANRAGVDGRGGLRIMREDITKTASASEQATVRLLDRDH
jgi:hypothetical protein